MALRRIYAAYDDEGVYVYQPFVPLPVEGVVEKDVFIGGLRMDHMTWIKPSFGWMLYRYRNAIKRHQKAVLKVKLSHDGFRTIMSRAENPVFVSTLYGDQAAWRDAMITSDVRYQWDPDYTLQGEPLERDTIQFEFTGETLRQYGHEWILSVEDVTALAKMVGKKTKNRPDLPLLPEEKEYPVDDTLRQRLMMEANRD